MKIVAILFVLVALSISVANPAYACGKHASSATEAGENTES